MITDSEQLALQTRAYLCLAQVSLSLYQPITAVQLSLTALRFLQSTGRDATCDSRLWLKTRVTLAECLSQIYCSNDWKQIKGLLSCDEVCIEGIKECEAIGDLETAAELSYITACYYLMQNPPLLKEVSSNVQSCLNYLESCVQLSDRSQVLRAEASLMLADVSCVQGEGHKEEMRLVYRGIVNMLEQQVSLPW